MMPPMVNTEKYDAINDELTKLKKDYAAKAVKLVGTTHNYADYMERMAAINIMQYVDFELALAMQRYEISQSERK